ncbi:unnamed protein product [Amoebophrya sp. A120]|nr:unnamed protein product [Amoebophrya sp. A120]|eukprot:GSA120T00005333001.1
MLTEIDFASALSLGKAGGNPAGFFFAQPVAVWTSADVYPKRIRIADVDQTDRYAKRRDLPSQVCVAFRKEAPPPTAVFEKGSSTVETATRYLAGIILTCAAAIEFFTNHDKTDFFIVVMRDLKIGNILQAGERAQELLTPEERQRLTVMDGQIELPHLVHCDFACYKELKVPQTGTKRGLIKRNQASKEAETGSTFNAAPEFLENDNDETEKNRKPWLGPKSDCYSMGKILLAAVHTFVSEAEDFDEVSEDVQEAPVNARYFARALWAKGNLPQVCKELGGEDLERFAKRVIANPYNPLQDEVLDEAVKKKLDAKAKEVAKNVKTFVQMKVEDDATCKDEVAKLKSAVVTILVKSLAIEMTDRPGPEEIFDGLQVSETLTRELPAMKEYLDLVRNSAVAEKDRSVPALRIKLAKSLAVLNENGGGYFTNKLSTAPSQKVFPFSEPPPGDSRENTFPFVSKTNKRKSTNSNKNFYDMNDDDEDDSPGKQAEIRRTAALMSNVQVLWGTAKVEADGYLHVNKITNANDETKKSVKELKLLNLSSFTVAGSEDKNFKPSRFLTKVGGQGDLWYHCDSRNDKNSVQAALGGGHNVQKLTYWIDIEVFNADKVAEHQRVADISAPVIFQFDASRGAA